MASDYEDDHGAYPALELHPQETVCPKCWLAHHKRFTSCPNCMADQ